MEREREGARIALVTGATRRAGIGAAICRALAADGADTAFTHWNAYDATMDWGGDPDGPAALKAELEGMGVRVAAFELDLSDPAAPARLMDAVERTLGPVTILVNNAAYSTHDGYEALDAATLDNHYAVNMRGAMLLSVEFARRFVVGPGGRIVFLTSGQGLGPMPDELAYAATKAAIEAFSLSLSAGVAAKGITVNTVDPGATDTGWMSEALKQELLSRSSSGRLGMPDDAARLIAFLASDAASWVTGQVVRSRGGVG